MMLIETEEMSNRVKVVSEYFFTPLKGCRCVGDETYFHNWVTPRASKFLKHLKIFWELVVLTLLST